jgi:hypothetical protein
MNRRQFTLATAAIATLPRTLFAQHKQSTFDLIAEVDHTRILTAAALYLQRPIQTVTSFVSPKSPGGPHDFYSQADYFWPNPANPTGPYINRDGQSNPENFNDHRRAMIHLSIEMPALTAAWLLDKKRNAKYGKRAGDYLRAWFVTPATRMNPNLEYGQAITGVNTGRNFGIIDTLHLVEVARAASLLTPEVFSAEDQKATRQWFTEYLHWMKTSDKGIKERDTLNNHAVCWALQAAEFARYIGDETTRAEVRKQYETKFVPDQLGPDGSFPKELARTKPYSYSIFNFDVMATLCQTLNDFSFALPDGRGICKAATFIYPFLKDKSTWPYKHDIQHFESLPVRSPGLLFCGVACKQPEYIAQWRTMNPDPTDPEVIRNNPIRQPLLWFASA